MVAWGTVVHALKDQETCRVDHEIQSDLAESPVEDVGRDGVLGIAGLYQELSRIGDHLELTVAEVGVNFVEVVQIEEKSLLKL